MLVFNQNGEFVDYIAARGRAQVLIAGETHNQIKGVSTK
jgi:hypothetical protein